MKYLIKYFEFNENNFDEEDIIPPIENNEIIEIENRLKNIYNTLGITFTKELKSEIIDIPEGRKLIKYYSYLFNFNFNKNKTSLLNLMCLYNAITYDNKIDTYIKKPLKYEGFIYPIQDESYLDDLRIYLTKYRKDRQETIIVNNSEIKSNYGHFYEENPEKIFQIINKFILENVNKITDKIYIQFQGNTDMPNLKECIKQYLILNNNLNNNIQIPDLLISEIKKSIEQFESYDIWKQIKSHNPLLYNKLKSQETDNAAELANMGFED